MAFPYAAIGLIGAALTVAYARSRGIRGEPQVFALVLVAMQAIYLGFVVAGRAWSALPVEGLLFALLCTAAFTARRGWLVLLPIGYLIHGLWDLYHGRAATPYVPGWYAIACVSYDWFLMIYFIGRLRLWRG